MHRRPATDYAMKKIRKHETQSAQLYERTRWGAGRDRSVVLNSIPRSAAEPYLDISHGRLNSRERQRVSWIRCIGAFAAREKGVSRPHEEEGSSCDAGSAPVTVTQGPRADTPGKIRRSYQPPSCIDFNRRPLTALTTMYCTGP